MRLYNGHRRILKKKPIQFSELIKLQSQPDGWRQILNPDVVKFVDDLEGLKLTESEERKQQIVKQLIHSPTNFFSRPSNVPLQLRKQIHLPDIVVSLVRTPQLSPKYAKFNVPLWFGKLDFKNYLKNVYNVDVIHIRSQVKQQPIEENTRVGGGSLIRGRKHRPASRKVMTVELVDPFEYPAEEKDLAPWEHDNFKAERKENRDMNSVTRRRDQRKTIAEQAQEYLQGKKAWAPTWQSMSTDQKLYSGTSRLPGLGGSAAS